MEGLLSIYVGRNGENNVSKFWILERDFQNTYSRMCLL